jgi:mRNA-degrading endonuclease RelE of RelBE toxin-antitoxin system
MPFSVELTARAHKEYQRLPDEMQDQIRKVLNRLEADPFSLDIKKLKTPFKGYRVRSGNYRILLTIEKKTVTIYSVENRKDAYRE